jgi:aromatic ring-cleaving dioxygenase
MIVVLGIDMRYENKKHEYGTLIDWLLLVILCLTIYTHPVTKTIIGDFQKGVDWQNVYRFYHGKSFYEIYKHAEKTLFN